MQKWVLIAFLMLIISCASNLTPEQIAKEKEAAAKKVIIPAGFDIHSLNFLECPITGQKLRLATQGEIENLNKEIDKLALGDLQGQPIRAYLRGLLIRTDSKVAYPVVRGEALLTQSNAIDLVRPAKSAPNRLNNMGRMR